MYLKLLNPRIEGVRENYALAKDTPKAYPKKSPEIEVKIGDETVPMRVTGSRNWATTETAGRNGWLRVNGSTCWLLFDVGFDPFAEPLRFELCEGKSPDANPKRAPRRPDTEAERVLKYKAWAAARTL